MRDLDETDVEILRLLVEDARRPFSDIGERVGLSGPAVSDRVARLREEGVVRRFTVDVDRSALGSGVPVLLDLRVRPDAVEAVAGALVERDRVEHVFTTADARVVVHAKVADADVRGFLRDAVDFADLTGFDVSLLSNVDWRPDVPETAFAVDCDECGNTVTEEGTTTRIDGDIYHFCCDSCLQNFEERYERLRDAA